MLMASSQCIPLAAVCPWEVNPLPQEEISHLWSIPSYKEDAFGITAFCAALLGSRGSATYHSDGKQL